MVSIKKLFELQKGASRGSADYFVGNIPFVASTERNNGVAQFVTPLEGDVTFQGGAVAISGLGHATVQEQEFLPKSNGGDALTVLIPRAPRSHAWLIAFAAYFNQAHKWRFGFGRKAGCRLNDIELDEALIERIASQVKIAKPAPVALEAGVLNQVVAKLRELYGENPTVGEVFKLKQGKATAVAALGENGSIPVVSATEKEVNAVAGYLSECAGELIPAGSISVAKDGKPGVARVQPVPYRATEHVLALVPKAFWDEHEKLVLAALVERQCWRFSFARAAAENRLSTLNLLDGLSAMLCT